MIGIQGIGGVQEPTPPKTGPGKAKAPEAVAEEALTDGVSISPEAAEASETSSVVSQAAAANEVRQERVEQARESIEKGTYKVQDVVRQVASRLTKFVS